MGVDVSSVGAGVSSVGAADGAGVSSVGAVEGAPEGEVDGIK